MFLEPIRLLILNQAFKTRPLCILHKIIISLDSMTYDLPAKAGTYPLDAVELAKFALK